MKKRWISLFVENEVGMLAKISGLFSGKSYNLQSLTVGETEDPTVSRMTIGLISDDITFEQIKKQLNRSVGIIKVIDFTDTPIHMKEILFVKVKGCNKSDREEVFRIAQVFGRSPITAKTASSWNPPRPRPATTTSSTCWTRISAGASKWCGAGASPWKRSACRTGSHPSQRVWTKYKKGDFAAA